MNALKRLLFCIAAAIPLLTMPLDNSAHASGWTWQDRGNGFFLKVDASGNHDGHWYTRARVCTKGCYGHCSCSYTYRVYSKITTSAYQSGGWRSELLKIAASAQEHKEYMDAIKTLGINVGGGYSMSGYGAGAGGYSVYGQATAGYGYPLAQQGNTVYGYSALVSNFGNLNVEGVLNQSYRLASQAQELSGQATSDYTSMTSQTVAAQERIAATLAQGQAAAQALSQARAEPSQPTFRTFTFKATSTADGLKFEPVDNGGEFRASGGVAVATGDWMARWNSLGPDFGQHCASCHGGGDRTAGGLDLKNAVNWNVEQRAEWFRKIKERIAHHDPAKRMPLAAGDQSGEPLPLDVLERLICNLQP